MGDHRFFLVPPGGPLRPLGSVAEALEAAKGEGYVWFDYATPSRDELSTLSEPLSIHPLTIEDCLDEDPIPKVEDFPEYTFVIVNSFDYREREVQITEVDCIIGKNFLVTVHCAPGEHGAFGPKLLEAIEVDGGNVRQGPDLLLHVVLDFVVDGKLRAIEAVQEEIDATEEGILQDLTAFHPEELMHLRRKLLAMRKSLFHEREVLMKVCRRDSPFITERAIYHFRDVYDHLARFFELVEISREMISGLMEIYLSMQNNRMSVAANYTNRVVRRLTLITTVFMPLTLLAGIGGMSEWSMMTGPSNWRISYPLFLLAMLAIGVIDYFILRWVDARKRPEDLALGAPQELGK